MLVPSHHTLPHVHLLLLKGHKHGAPWESWLGVQGARGHAAGLRPPASRCASHAPRLLRLRDDGVAPRGRGSSGVPHLPVDTSYRGLLPTQVPMDGALPKGRRTTGTHAHLHAEASTAPHVALRSAGSPWALGTTSICIAFLNVQTGAFRVKQMSTTRDRFQ